MQDKASCEQHDKHRRSCGNCAVAEVDAMSSRYFPEEMLGPWQARVARDLGAPWEARMRPYMGGERELPRWVLTRTDRVGTVTVETWLAGGSQGDLIRIASDFHAPR